MWNFKSKKRTHLLQKVNPSSLFSFTPDLPWTQLPWFNLFKTRPRFLCFIKEGYAKIDTQPQVKVKKHLKNQDVVPSPTQCLIQTYTACQTVFKVKTIPLIVLYKNEITIGPVGKSQKEGKLETPKVTRSPSVDTKGYKSTFLPDTDYRIEGIDKKKVFMQKILQNLKTLAKMSRQIRISRGFIPL